MNVRFTPRNQNFLATSVHNVEDSEPLTFETVNNVTSAPLEIDILPDDVVDRDGTIQVTLEADNNTDITYSVAPFPSNSAAVNIRDDDLPNLSIDDEAGNEGSDLADGSVVFTPTLDAPAGRNITISYTTAPIGDFPVAVGDYSVGFGMLIMPQLLF